VKLENFTREDQREIAFITVNYCSANATALLLGDLLEQQLSSLTLTIVVADNSPSGSDLDALRIALAEHKEVRFLRMPSNLGYLGAAQIALNTYWKDRFPDWVIVSNPDIRLPQRDFLERIATATTSSAVIAPRIISTRTGLDQNPFHRARPSKFRMQLNRAIPRVPVLFQMMEWQCAIKNKVRSRLRRSEPASATDPEAIYAPHGAFLIFSRKYFERGGSLNVGAFLFAEEKFVAETCRMLGLGVFYDPSFEIHHDEHVATSHSSAVRHFQISAADYIYREFFTRTGPQVKC